MNGLEALWAVEFEASTGWGGAGVVVFESGRIFGGDGGYYYTGTYTVEQKTINAKVTAVHYHGPRNNVFGPVDRISLNITGELAGDKIVGQGRVPDMPGRSLAFRMRRLANLP